MRLCQIVFLGVLASFLLVGCSSEPLSKAPSNQGERRYQGTYPIRAVATTGMVADIVRHIGGPKVQVEQLFGQDVDPHLYKATPKDVSTLSAAEAIFYSGLHLEGKMGDLLERQARRTLAVAVAEHIDPKLILRDEAGHPDPHVWFDASLWSQAADGVREALVAFDPTNASEYQVRGEKYTAELALLHEEARGKIATIPENLRVLVTSHDAFRYFGRAYKIEVKGIQGISTEAEASVRDVNQLVNFISQRKVKAVFVESSVNQRNMKSLIEGCKSAGHDVALGGELYSDAMGAVGTPEGTYVGMIRHNVETVVKALK